MTALLIIAAGCFALTFILALAGASAGRIHLIALGLTCWVLTELLPRL